MPAHADRLRRRRRRLWGALAVLLILGPGVYRVEVDLRVNLFPIGGVVYRPWIFSNPVYVRG